MGKILCAIRGGEASFRTQDAAIALARERGEELLFLYVVDTRFLDRTARPFRRDTVTAEMRKMGEFLLHMALERAQAQGVRASLLVRYGDLCKELKAATHSEDVSVVALGRPQGEDSIFTDDELRDLAAEIGIETGVEAVVL